MATRRDAMRLLASGGVGLAADVVLLGAQTPASELLIRRGRVANADGIRDADVRIVGEIITEIGRGLRPGAGARVIDATGRLVLPGGIDPHTHVSPDYGIDDLTVVSTAALVGGITMIGTFAGAGKGETVQDALDSCRTA